MLMHDPNIERMEQFAASGEPMPIAIDIQGSRFFGRVIVTKREYGQYDCAAAGPLKKTWIPVERMNPWRLPE